MPAAPGTPSTPQRAPRPADRTDSPQRVCQDVTVAAGPVHLPGRLTTPAGPACLVVHVQTGDDDQFATPAQVVVEQLYHAGLGTLRVDLLTAERPVNGPDMS